MPDTPAPDILRRLIIVIPALNEEATIERVIRDIPETIPGSTTTEVMVIDDGSTDRTAAKARAAGASVISHGMNRGVGIAFRTGIREALIRHADVIVFMDGDGQFQPQDIPALIRPILEGTADITTCTRFLDPRRYPEMPPIKIWGNRMVRLIINLTTGKRFTDVSCGFRAYSRDAALRLTLFGKFTYTHEVIFDAVQKGLRIVERPFTVRGEREVGQSRVARNVFMYALQWLAIFFRALRDSSPLQVFGVLATITEGIGISCGLVVFVHWLKTGQTFPYRSLVILSGIFILLGAFLFTIALLADMLRRQRVLIEDLLYFTRKSVYDQKDDSRRTHG